MFYYLFSTDSQIRFTPEVGDVRNLSQPAVLWVLTGDVLVDGKVVATLIRMRLVMNPTPKKVMKTGAQLLSEMLPLLWRNITVEKK